MLRYKFSSEKQPPNFYQDTTGGYGTADIASVANQRTASGYYAYTTNYNPWNGPATGYQAHKRYVNSSNVNLQYYEDIEITGDGLTSLKNAVKAAATGGDDGHIYAHLGFPITDAQSETSSGQYGQYPHSVIMIIASRVELKIVATWN